MNLLTAGTLLFVVTAQAAPITPLNLGPVGPHEPIMATFGNKSIIAFYEPDNGRCSVHAVVYEKTDPKTGDTTASRVRITLEPKQVVHIDAIDNQSVHLQCGDQAEKLSLVE
jgi:hypothetical protein